MKDKENKLYDNEECCCHDENCTCDCCCADDVKEEKFEVRENLTDEEIEKMRKEAEANKEADEKRKAEADARNEADSAIFQTEKAIKDLGDKVSDDDKKDAESKIEELKKALEGSDIETIEKKTTELKDVAMKMSSKVYEEINKANAVGMVSDTYICSLLKCCFIQVCVFFPIFN